VAGYEHIFRARCGPVTIRPFVLFCFVSFYFILFYFVLCILGTASAGSSWYPFSLLFANRGCASKTWGEKKGKPQNDTRHPHSLNLRFFAFARHVNDHVKHVRKESMSPRHRVERIACMVEDREGGPHIYAILREFPFHHIGFISCFHCWCRSTGTNK